MALRPEYLLVDSEFSDYFVALIGNEKSGMQLTFLSALTRLSFAPWREAVQHSNLIKERKNQYFRSRKFYDPRTRSEGGELAVDRCSPDTCHVSPSAESPTGKSIEYQKPKSEAPLI